MEYDLGHLAAYDSENLNMKKLGSDPAGYLNAQTRENVQLLLNKLFKQPSEDAPDNMGRIADLPDPMLQLPREKPVPKPKPLTTWEKFARTKGITKKSKRAKMVWDEQKQEWAPRHGYKRANDEMDSWAIPAEEGEQTGVLDPWKRASDAKKERVAKNKKQQLKNAQAAAPGNRLPGTLDLTAAVRASGGESKSKASQKKKEKHHVDVALALAQKSTGSMGKFDQRRDNEAAMQKTRSKKKDAEFGKSRQAEKESSLSVLNKVLGRMPKDEELLNVDRAANMKQVAQETEKRVEKKKKWAAKQDKGKKKRKYVKGS